MHGARTAATPCSAADDELDTLLGWAPDRLGHVIHVPDHVRRRIAATPGIGLELCLSCNVHAKMVAGGFEAHHFREWWRVEDVVVVPCVSLPPPPPPPPAPPPPAPPPPPPPPAGGGGGGGAPA